MKKYLWIILLGILTAWTSPAHAQFFARKPKANPVQRVPELVGAVKADADDRKRANAAEELGTFDGKAFPEIVPVLVEVVQTDAKSNVRYEAVSSLGSMRPVSIEAGMALERVASSDDSWKVRWHAKTVLVKYRLAGYSTPKMEKLDPKGPKLEEPPLKGAKLDKATPPPAQFPTASGSKKTQDRVVVSAAKTDPPAVPKQMPTGPSFSTAIPQGPTIIRNPVPMTEEGPELTPVPPPPVRNPF